MCYSPEAPLYAFVFLSLHVLVYAGLAPRTAFGREVRPFALLLCVSWIGVETFDLALWQAHIQNRCFDLVTVSGTLSIMGVICAINALIWYRRGRGWAALEDWDARMWFLGACLIPTSLVWSQVSGNAYNLIPEGPLETTDVFGEVVHRNLWFGDHPMIYSWALPLYVTPLLRGLYDNWQSADRFGRMVEQFLVFTLLSWILAFVSSMAAWGSVWCFTACCLVLILDVHVALAETGIGAPGTWVAHPFSIWPAKRVSPK